VIKAEQLYLSLPRAIVSPEREEIKDECPPCPAEDVMAETELMAEQLLNDARLRAEKVIAEARVEAERIVDKARSEAGELEEKARQDGYEAGLQEGKEALAGERRKLDDEINAKRQSLVEERNLMLDRLEPDAVQLAVIMARGIVHTELLIAPEQINAIAKAVLSKAKGDGELLLKVSPQNYDAVKSFIDDELASDEQIKVGINNTQDPGCRLETPFGEIDASIEGQFQEIVRTLQEVSRK
jgi:flagellar assembly protein FliH